MTSAWLVAAALTHWAVDPMSETQYLPNTVPDDGVRGGVVQIIAAKGEYEPGAFVLRSEADLGRVKLVVGDLRTADGRIFPKEKLDLKTVKVWYQNGNAWFSYFADKGRKLCPELLLNDEDLIRVDEERQSNYARLTEKDGRVHWFWLNNPAAFQNRAEDVKGFYFRLGDVFICMRENFMDAKVHCGARLEKGRSKQFLLTANVTEDTAAGLYRGEIKVKSKSEKEKGAEFSIPIALRVLDFALPEPMCWADVNKPFVTYFRDYTSLNMIRDQNGDDPELARRQLVAICRDFAAHGQVLPSFADAIDNPDIVREGGQCYCDCLSNGKMELSDICVSRAAARQARRLADRRFGRGSRPYMTWGDEYGIFALRGIRPMVKTYQDFGFRFPINSPFAYAAGITLADLFWPPCTPDHESAEVANKYAAATGGKGCFGWYSSQHVGVENPAFTRRQYGFGPYRAGFTCNFNYAHHLDAWNDSVDDLYRPMALVYGTGGGCIDTLAWEGFREGLDDIRYATLLKRLAEPLLDSLDTNVRYEARLAVQLLVDADKDNMDLTTLRLEMIRHILRLAKVKGRGNERS